MRVRVKCPSCRTAYRIDEGNLGASAKCPKCSQTFTLALSADETAREQISPVASLAPVQGAPSAMVSPAEAEHGAMPARIGRYVIQRKIGAGTMGIVYQARDPDLDRDVAVKVLPPEYGRDEEYLKRFLREARLAAKLHHTNTVGVYEVRAQNDLAYLAMELVDGESLDKLVSPGRPMPWREATRAICDAAAGLAAAHEIGLIHRDVKPANLMRSRKGVTKVVDFGLARALTTSTQLTQHGLVMGTPAYMPPEQWVGQELDARSDLYALVCSYYQLLTGRLPFNAPSAPALGYQHRHEPLPDPRQFVPRLPDGVCRALAKGAQKQPKDRYQKATDLVADLEAILAARQESLLFRSHRSRVASGLKSPASIIVGAVLLGFLGIIIGYLLLFRNPPQFAEREIAKEQQREGTARRVEPKSHEDRKLSGPTQAPGLPANPHETTRGPSARSPVGADTRDDAPEPHLSPAQREPVQPQRQETHLQQSHRSRQAAARTPNSPSLTSRTPRTRSSSLMLLKRTPTESWRAKSYKIATPANRRRRSLRCDWPTRPKPMSRMIWT